MSHRWFPVTASATDFLVIGFGWSGHVRMKHETNIRFINTHTKSDGRHHYKIRLSHKAVEVFFPPIASHACMVTKCIDPCINQRSCRFLRFFSRKTVNDTIFLGPAFHEIEKLIFPSFFDLDIEFNIRSIKPRKVCGYVIWKNLLTNLLPRHLIRSCSEGNYWNAWISTVEKAEILIFRAKCSTPLRNAVRFIDCK